MKRKLLDYLLALAILLMVWEGLSLALKTPALPSPMVAVPAFGRELFTSMGRHLLVSTWRVLASIALALILAVPLGLYVGRHERNDLFKARKSFLARWTPRIAPPLIYLIYPVPKVVLLPVIMVILGIGDTAKIFLITLVVFFQILVTARDAARSVSPGSVLSVVSLGARERHIYRHVIFPAALPKIFTALRISLGTAIAVLFLSETFATNVGIGYYVVETWSRIAYGEMFAGVIAMGLLGLVLYLILDWLERLTCPWEYLK